MKKWIFRIWGRAIIWVFGWKVDQHLKADFKRCVMVAAPHTSNWDFVICRAAFEVMELPVRFTIKKEWTKGFLGGLLVSLGAIGIDRKPKDKRSEPISYVDAMVNLFEENEELAVLVTPEGSRKRMEQWKTGFYHVAKKAGVPIAFGYLDYKTKTAGIGKVIWPGEDMEADMREIMKFYAGIHPKFPELFSVDLRYLPKD
jgi:1-acyl-sn-glycerol-3-phosphate acyltransferase